MYSYKKMRWIGILPLPILFFLLLSAKTYSQEIPPLETAIELDQDGTLDSIDLSALEDETGGIFTQIGTEGIQQEDGVIEIGGQVDSDETVILESGADTEEGIATEHEQEIFKEVNSEISDFLNVPVKLLVRPPKGREYKKSIILDGAARHSCEAESFVVDVSYSNSVVAAIRINRGDTVVDGTYSIEIGSLPGGIDISLMNSSDKYSLNSIVSERVSLSITKENISQKGSFNIPIIFSFESGGTKSTSVCQINIINTP